MNVPHANSNMYMANLRNVQAYFTCLANINMYMVNLKNVQAYFTCLANINMYMVNLKNVQAYFTCLANINMYMVNSRHALIRVHVQYKSCNDVLFLAFAGHTFDKNWY